MGAERSSRGRGVSGADILEPWAVEFRYETAPEPALDRAAALKLVEEIISWADGEIGR